MPGVWALLFREVMDKEPGILGFWISALVLGGAGFMLARRRWWWALPVLALLAVAGAAAWAEWTDPFVGPAIAQEAGNLYPVHLIGSGALATALTLAGLIRDRRSP